METKQHDHIRVTPLAIDADPTKIVRYTCDIFFAGKSLISRTKETREDAVNAARLDASDPKVAEIPVALDVLNRLPVEDHTVGFLVPSHF